MKLANFLMAFFVAVLVPIHQDIANAEQVSADDYFRIVDEKMIEFEMLDGATLFQIWINAIQRARSERSAQADYSMFILSEASAVSTAAAVVIARRDAEGVPGFAAVNGVVTIFLCVDPALRVELESACSPAIPRLEFAAISERDALAMKMLGLAYSEGIVVAQSNLVASDWYSQAAERYVELGDRTEALVMIEKSLALFPENSRAADLRDTLFE